MESFHWVVFVLSLSLVVLLAVILTPTSPSVSFRQNGWFGPGFAWLLGWAALALGLIVGLREQWRRIWDWI